MDLPYPPFELAHRVGTLADADDPWAVFDRHGASARTAIEHAIGGDWTWEGRTVLDFGAGAGRTLRHFADRFEAAEFHACDIDDASVEWLGANLPGVIAFANRELPPLDRADGTFDLIYTISVFTHLLDSWTDWLLELRRVLRPGGLLVTSFMGRNEAQWLAGMPFDEDRTGMFGWAAGQSWDDGGPMVMHSPWWITEHWGRAFEVRRIVLGGEADPRFQHGLVVLRHPGTAAPTAEALVAAGPDPREAPALAHNLTFVQGEARRLRQDLRWLGLENDRLRETVAERERALGIYAGSSSWRLTAPLRRAATLVRGRRSRA